MREGQRPSEKHNFRRPPLFKLSQRRQNSNPIKRNIINRISALFGRNLFFVRPDKQEDKQGSQRAQRIGEYVFLRIPNIALRTEHLQPRFAAVNHRILPFDDFVSRRQSPHTAIR